MTRFDKDFQIPKHRLTFKFSRSAGPGGQNVNKVNTRVTVSLDILTYPDFTESEKKRILTKLATRANKEGQIHVTSQRHRTQKENRIAAIERLHQLLIQALRKKTIRKKTPIPYSAKVRRLEEKNRRSALKKHRAKKDFSKELTD